MRHWALLVSFRVILLASSHDLVCEPEDTQPVSLLQNPLQLHINARSEAQIDDKPTIDSERQLFVIGVGPPKTATTSTKEALRILGFKAAHGSTMFSSAYDPVWGDAYHGNYASAIQKILDEGYNATAGDLPWCVIYKELMEVRPNFKVIMSVHPGGPDAWVDSTDTWNEFHTRQFFSPGKHPEVESRKITDFPPERLNEHLYASELDCFINETHNQTWRDRCKAGYLAHYDRVRKAVPPERLLELNVSEGWAPLCNFLNVPVPDVEFPDKNDRTNNQSHWHEH